MRQKHKKIKMYLFFHGIFPGKKAADLFAAHSADSFQGAGAEIVLVAPRRLGRVKKAAQEYYGLNNAIQVVYLPTVDLFEVPIARKVAFWASYVTFSICACLYILLRVPRGSIVYSNEALVAFMASWLHSSVAYELHDFPEKTLWMYQILFRRVQKIITTNQWKKGNLVERFGIPEDKIIVESNAVDIEQFDPPENKRSAREKLGLPQDQKIVLYTGHLYGWKGVDVLAEAAAELPESVVYFIGGTDEDIELFLERHNTVHNIVMKGYRPHAEIPLWQRAADVLVLPNSGKENISRYYTSPMKLFEYMASGTPIVASRLPSIEEVVSERDVIFVEPDSPQSLSEGIREALATGENSSRTESARRRVQDHSWEARAQRILAEVEYIS